VRGDGICHGQAITGLLARVPLRVRLAAIACCLVAAGAGIIGLTGSLAVRGYLMPQADQELRAYADLVTSGAFTAMPAGFDPGGAAGSAFLIEVVGPAGQLVMSTGTQPAPASARIPFRAGQLATVPAASGGGSWLVVARPVHYRAQRILYTYTADDFSLSITSTARPGTAGRLVVGLDLSSIGRAISRLTVICAEVSGAAILAVAFLGLAVIRTILRPLTQMEKITAAVAAGGLSHRVPDRHARGDARNPARSLNTMQSQIEHAYNTSTASADAARSRSEQIPRIITGTGCELRRPLGVIRGFAQYYQQRGRPAARELDRMMARVAEEAAHMDALLDDLLLLPLPGQPGSHDNDRST
jgi:two-component system, OmpR family, sensor kinase